jgi:hypothetical protein
MSKKQSYLEQIQDIETKDLNFNEHILLCIEVDDNGLPIGSALKVQGTPYQTLGMIDVAIRKLEEARESIHDKFQSVEKASRMLNELPIDMVKKIRKFEDEARQAMSDGDIEKLEELKNKVRDELGILGEDSDNPNDSDEPTDFNINDFKGRF